MVVRTLPTRRSGSAMQKCSPTTTGSKRISIDSRRSLPGISNGSRRSTSSRKAVWSAPMFRWRGGRMAARLNSLPGPDDVYREVLPNGITVLVRSNFNSPSVVIAGYFDAGALFDPDEKLGLAEYTVAALMRGTQKRSFDEIYNALEAVGASLGFNTGVH